MHRRDNQFSRDFNYAYANFDAVVPTQPGDDWVNWDDLQFIYQGIIRRNRRENLFFLQDEPPTVPWDFYTGQPEFTVAQQAIRDQTAVDMAALPPKSLQIQSKRPYSPAELLQQVQNAPTSVTPPTTTSATGAPVPITVQKGLPSPIDTVTPAPPAPPVTNPRPKWNEGQWDEGSW